MYTYLLDTVPSNKLGHVRPLHRAGENALLSCVTPPSRPNASFTDLQESSNSQENLEASCILESKLEAQEAEDCICLLYETGFVSSARKSSCAQRVKSGEVGVDKALNRDAQQRIL